MTENSIIIVSLPVIILLLYFAIRRLIAVVEESVMPEQPAAAVLDEAGNLPANTSMELLQVRYYTSEPAKDEDVKEPEVYYHRPRLLNIYYRSEFSARIEQMLNKGIISRL